MHPNPSFRNETGEKNIAFARGRGFGVLAVNGPQQPMLSHVPFLISDDSTFLDLHLVRSNPIVRMLEKPQGAKIAVSGPDSYISPDWYGVPDQVPTWNYIAVHLSGRLELLPQSHLREMLDRQSAFFEERLRPKAPWKSEKMTPEVMERMMRQIVPCRMSIDDVQGTWKLNQNKASDARQSAADHVGEHGVGSELLQLARMMREV